MSKAQEDLLRRPLYVYDLPPQVLDTLTLKADASIVTSEELSRIPRDVSPSASSENLVGSQSCSLCSLTFPTVQEQRSHLKSDFHNYNLKQKLRGQNPVSETEFEKLVGDLDESLSGSDSEDTEEDEDDGRPESTLTALLKRQAKIADKNNPGEMRKTGTRKMQREAIGEASFDMVQLSSTAGKQLLWSLPGNSHWRGPERQ
uniref:C2H2-type domain-containing protein n=1 Tax=Bionectria ochroleuca TaxID=29856 RepID=A0A8H7NKI4_BIOOC